MRLRHPTQSAHQKPLENVESQLWVRCFEQLFAQKLRVASPERIERNARVLELAGRRLEEWKSAARPEADTDDAQRARGVEDNGGGLYATDDIAHPLGVVETDDEVHAARRKNPFRRVGLDIIFRKPQEVHELRKWRAGSAMSMRHTRRVYEPVLALANARDYAWEESYFLMSFAGATNRHARSVTSDNRSCEACSSRTRIHG